MSNGVFNFNFLALILYEILGGPKFTIAALRPLDTPSGEIFLPKASTSQYLIVFFNFNILALVVSELLGGPKFMLEGSVFPCMP